MVKEVILGKKYYLILDEAATAAFGSLKAINHTVVTVSLKQRPASINFYCIEEINNVFVYKDELFELTREMEILYGS